VGQCGGSVTYDGTYDDETDYTDVEVAASNFCNDQQTLNGRLSIEGYSEALTINFNYFNIRDEYLGSNATLNGRTEFIDNYPNYTVKADIVIQDNQLNRLYMLKNWRETVDETTFTAQISVSGDLYESDKGYVTVSTLEPIETNVDGYPESGKIKMMGDGSTAWVTFYSSSYLVEVDSDNDALIDDNNVYSYD